MAGTENKVWFYMQLGHRRGPVTKEQLTEMLTNEEIFIESTQVWCEGMDDWEKLDECKAFNSVVKKVREAAEKVDANVRHAITSEGVDEDLIARGASRALFNVFFYIGWMIPVLIGVAVLTELQVYRFIEPEVVNKNNLQIIIPLGLAVIALWQLATSRMRHAGYSGVMGLTVFVPVWNFFTFFICLFAPQNFKRKKKFGKGGLAYGLLFLIALVVPLIGLVPGLSVQSLNPVLAADKISDTYKLQTSYSARLKKSEQESSEREAKQKAMEESSKKAKGRDGALLERQKQFQ